MKEWCKNVQKIPEQQENGHPDLKKMLESITSTAYVHYYGDT